MRTETIVDGFGTSVDVTYVTVEEIIEAARKNGYTWHGHGGAPNSSNVERLLPCIVGQSMLNLGAACFPTDHSYQLIPGDYEETYRRNVDLKTAFRDVYNYNDYHAETYSEALGYMAARLAPFVFDEICIGVTTPETVEAIVDDVANESAGVWCEECQLHHPE